MVGPVVVTQPMPKKHHSLGEFFDHRCGSEYETENYIPQYPPLSALFDLQPPPQHD
jgi:hypothetical protein